MHVVCSLGRPHTQLSELPNNTTEITSFSPGKCITCMLYVVVVVYLLSVKSSNWLCYILSICTVCIYVVYSLGRPEHTQLSELPKITKETITFF